MWQWVTVGVALLLLLLLVLWSCLVVGKRADEAMEREVAALINLEINRAT